MYLELPVQADPGAVEKPCLPTQPFGVRNGYQSWLLEGNVGSLQAVRDHRAVFGGENPRVGLEVKSSS